MTIETVLRKFGNSQGVIISKALCEQVGLTEGSPISVSADAGCIVITPKAGDVSSRIGVARGEKLVADDWDSPEANAEIAGMLGALQ